MLLCLIGCSDNNRWEIRQTVKPEVLNQLDDKISIKYSLGPFMVLDDLTLKNNAQAIYIFKTKDEGAFELDVVVQYSDGWTASNNGFFYYFNKSRINGRYGSKPIALSKIQAAESEIPGFKWIEKEDGSIEEPVEKESVLEKKLTSNSEKTL